MWPSTASATTVALSERLDLHDHVLTPGDEPHAHSAYFVNGGTQLIAADLGVGAVFRYDVSGATLAPAAQPTLALPDGAGPRHIAVHPDGRRYYVVNELNSTVSLVEGLGTATHTITATASTLPEDARDTENYPSHVALSADGRHLYVANRGHQSIAVFDVDAGTGRLSPKQHIGVGATGRATSPSARTAAASWWPISAPATWCCSIATLKTAGSSSARASRRPWSSRCSCSSSERGRRRHLPSASHEQIPSRRPAPESLSQLRPPPVRARPHTQRLRRQLPAGKTVLPPESQARLQ